ncbi:MULTISPECIES: hypothetical protein [Acinetobacter]|jgi:hypothetical protein|uniref:hypothetical protein n=1 Tax=Acinetobacter TaxID=469 RepID=UPI000CECA58C|nr:MULTISPECIES: hypothetical protein [Acinetobacter]QIZ60505.1 hypothetical protein FK538_00065 [Acinetobacter indicus]UIP26510.1 hypothetical protein LZG54_14015 [Acinetobacter towneri]
MSKDKKDEDLVSLSRKNFNKPRWFRANEDGVFYEVTWEEFFKNHDDPTGLEDFMTDREQDTPRDVDL